MYDAQIFCWRQLLFIWGRFPQVSFLTVLDVSQVVAKRTNRPGISTTDRGFPRARFRSRGGSFSSRARYYSGYTPPRGRGRAFRWADARHITDGERCWSYKSYQQFCYRGTLQHFWSGMLNYESRLTLFLYLTIKAGPDTTWIDSMR